MASVNAVVTETARKKLVQARAGAIDLPAITMVAFGDGGVDSSGTVIVPDETQTELNNELLRKEVDGYTFPEDTTCRYTVSLDEDDLADVDISEIALVDSEGDIVGIKNFSAKGKDDDVTMTFTIDDVF